MLMQLKNLNRLSTQNRAAISAQAQTYRTDAPTNPPEAM
jgi:hypothetical protein